jgi:hypothetical protein
VRLAANAEATASFAAGALEVSGQIVFEVR